MTTCLSRRPSCAVLLCLSLTFTLEAQPRQDPVPEILRQLAHETEGGVYDYGGLLKPGGIEELEALAQGFRTEGLTLWVVTLPREVSARRSSGRIYQFAHSLVGKRLRLARPLLAATGALLGEALAGRFHAYCESAPLTRRLSGPQEALGFLSFLKDHPGHPGHPDHAGHAEKTEELPPFHDQALAYDTLRLELLVDRRTEEPLATAAAARRCLLGEGWRDCKPQLGPHLKVGRFPHWVEDASRSAARVEDRDTEWILLVRRPRDQRVASGRIKAPTRLLLARLDGRHTVAEVVAELESSSEIPSTQRSALEGECRKFLERLASEGVLGLATGFDEGDGER